MKKFIALLLAITTLVSLSVVPVYAAESYSADSSIGTAVTNVSKAILDAAKAAVDAAMKLAKSDIKVQVVNMSSKTGKTQNMTEVKFTDARPIIVEGRTLIPIRVVAEAIGYDVSWNGDTAEVILKSNMSMKGYDGIYPNRYNQAESVYSCFIDLEKGKNIKKEAPGFYGSVTKKNCDKFADFVKGHGGNFENIVRMGVNNPKATSTVYSDVDMIAQGFWGVFGSEMDLYKKYSKPGHIVAHYKMDVAPMVIDGRTYIPLRAATELMGMNVKWDNDTRTVTITADSAK